MSIIDTFDNLSEEILKPNILVNKVEDFPEIVVVTFKEKILNIVSNMDGAVQIGELHVGFTVPIYKINYKGKSIAVYQTLIGGAGSVMCLEEIIAKGGRKFIYFGSCGTLGKDVAAGHFIIPTEVYRDEGTSYHYAPIGDYINVKTSSKLEDIFNNLKLPFISAKVWTTDAFYRETINNMMKRKSEGCIAVDMECASIMSVGQYRNVDVHQFLYAEDTLDGIEWDGRTMGKVPLSTYEIYLKTALEVAVML